jgi:hypothetical protein
VKKKHIIIGTLLATLTTLLVGISVLAQWQGPYWELVSYDIGLDEDSGWMSNYNEWELYWDSGQGRYTQYNILNDSYGYVEVDQDSGTAIRAEEATLEDYQGVTQDIDSWSDIVYQGNWWKEYFPSSDTTLTKLSNPQSDATSISWAFTWNRFTYCGSLGWGWITDWTRYFFSIDESEHGVSCY